MAIAALLLAPSGPAAARGLFLETAPWAEPALADSVLHLAVGMWVAHGDTSAVLFPFTLAPFRRGPVQLAARWGFVSSRTATQRAGGFADPKLFARVRLAGGDSSFAVLHADAAARIPTATPELFPWASGGQELELGGDLRLVRLGVHAGVGRIWQEPGSGSGLARRDVPHATHVWVGAARRAGGHWAFVARTDGLWFRGGGTRGVAQVAGVWRDAERLRIEARAACEFGAARAFDVLGGLRFATPLR